MDSVSVVSRTGNTKTVRNRCRAWCFTLNNWTDAELSQCIDTFTVLRGKWIIGDEVGENGTPHLQGYVFFPNQIEFSSLKKVNDRIHWEKAKGTKEQNIKYCSKEKVISRSIPLSMNERLLSGYENVEWRDWQTNIINLVEGPIDPRAIHWFWEPDGNVGKSFLTKYLVIKYKCILGDGKKADIFNQIKTWLETHEDESPKCIVIDIPRSNLEYVCWTAIEKIKDGCFYSGKYEGGMCVYEIPHVVVFANAEPPRAQLSLDRWDIKRIN